MAILTQQVPQGMINVPGRRMAKSDVTPIPYRWRFVLELKLIGCSNPQIEEITGYSIPTIYRILADQRTILEKQQIMKAYDQEFELLFPKVIETIKDGLDSNDEKIQQDAAKTWLKAHGKFQTQPSVQNQLTAEQMVVQILQEARQDRQQIDAGREASTLQANEAVLDEKAVKVVKRKRNNGRRAK